MLEIRNDFRLMRFILSVSSRCSFIVRGFSLIFVFTVDLFDGWIILDRLKDHTKAKYDKAPFKIIWKPSCFFLLLFFTQQKRTEPRLASPTTSNSSYDTVACSANRSARWMKNVNKVKGSMYSFSSFASFSFVQQTFGLAYHESPYFFGGVENFAQKR